MPGAQDRPPALLPLAGGTRSPTPSWDEAHLANAVFDAHRDDPEFGYRFLADEVSDAGFAVCERTVWKICAANGWWSVFGKKKARKTAKVAHPGP